MHRRILAAMSIASRVPAFLLLTVGVVAAALLIAGYGVPVGIGLIAGLLLGAAALLALVGLSRRAAWSAPIRSWGTQEGSAHQPDRALMERHGRDAMRVAAVDASTLRRVVAVGGHQDNGGARVELIVVELREDGGIATLVAHTRPPVGVVGHLVEAAVSDDVGTAYVASGQASSGSGPGTSRHEIRFAPAPPEGAHVLSIEVASFVDPFPQRVAELVGPWEFRIPL